MEKDIDSSQIQESNSTDQATASKHVYDVDVLNIYNLLKNKANHLKSLGADPEAVKTNREFLERLLYAQQLILKDYRRRDKKPLKSRTMLVVYPKNGLGNYSYWLGLLLLADPYKVSLILDYHYQNWRDKGRFVGQVEYTVLKHILSLKSMGNHETLTELRQWIREKRTYHPYPNLLNSLVKKPTPDIIADQVQHNPVSATTELASALAQSESEIPKHRKSPTENILSPTLKITEKTAEEAILRQLKSLLFDAGDYKYLKQILNGKLHNKPLRIDQKGSHIFNYFGELYNKNFLRISSKKLLSFWLHQAFLCRNKQAGGFAQYSLRYIAQTLSGKNKPNPEDTIKTPSKLPT